MENISLNFKYSKEQIVKAYQFHYASIFHPKRDLTIALLLLFTGVYFLIIDGFGYIMISLVLVSICFIALQFFSFYIIPYVIFNRELKFKEEYNLIFTNESVFYKTKGIDSEIKWSHYNKISESNDFILLYYGKNSFTILPKKAFKKDDDLKKLKQILLETGLKNKVFFTLFFWQLKHISILSFLFNANYTPVLYSFG